MSIILSPDLIVSANAATLIESLPSKASSNFFPNFIPASSASACTFFIMSLVIALTSLTCVTGLYISDALNLPLLNISNWSISS
jgi:hypothetical protein